MATLKCSQMVLALFLASQAFSLAQYQHVIVMYVIVFSIAVKEMEVKGQETVRVIILPRFIIVLLMLVVLLVLATVGQRERQVLDISHSIGVEKLTPDEREVSFP